MRTAGTGRTGLGGAAAVVVLQERHRAQSFVSSVGWRRAQAGVVDVAAQDLRSRVRS
jgi:hypothetical protein